MTFTRHGHHISGSPFLEEPVGVARCGGPRLCGVCWADSIEWQTNMHFISLQEAGINMADNLGANPVPPSPADHQLQAKILVVDYANDHFEKTDGTQISIDNVYVVWFTFVLGSWKALVSTNLPDGKYYEVTHNRAKGETYVDVYVKIDNVAVSD